LPEFFAALWLVGLLFAAPVLHAGPSYRFVDRLRDALILGVAIPFALALFHLLYPAALWIVLAALAAIAAYRRASVESARETGSLPLLLAFSLAAVSWPGLIRPLLDGDSLSYHLPNAASWVQAHSLWTTATRYWWYPPGSEMFAAGLYAVAGPFCIGWSGFAALALLGCRIEVWARLVYRAPWWLSDALAAATVTALPLALQAASLQNDVWLAAFFLETLWLLRNTGAASLRTIAVTALIKPYGWIVAAIAALTRRASVVVWAVGFVAIAFWAVRCAALAPHAIVPFASTWVANTAGSSIAAHGPAALALFVRVAVSISPFVFVAFLASLAGVAYEKQDRGLAWAGFLAAVFFLVMPFVYDNGTPQLATGASLRQASPAIAAGALLLLRPALRLPYAAYALLLASTVWGVWSVLAIYWNDAPTQTALAVAPIAVAAVWLARRLRAPWPAIAAFAIAVVAAGSLATRHTADFYADALRAGTKGSGIYAWLQRTQPTAIGGWGLRLGAVNVLSPRTRTIDLADAQPCAQARANGVMLVAVAESDRPAATNAARLAAARACGTVAYDDGTAVAANP
jgi:hypothetical protein